MQPIIIKILRLNNRHNNDFYCLLVVLEQNWHLIIKCQTKDSKKGRSLRLVCIIKFYGINILKKNQIHNYL